MKMSSRPFLVQAIFDWVIENGYTPFLMIDTTVEGVCVPPQHIVDDEIVLNLSADAISHFVLNKEYIQFKTRFNAKIEEIYAPMEAVKALYGKEDMSGIGFAPDGTPYFAGDLTGNPFAGGEGAHLQDVSSDGQGGDDGDSKPPRKGPPHLTLVE